uniref:DUF4806 domain-containing protein n=1 Tax=Anopheles stephensi TaxID=30069 RepID=A0A182Y0V9_ANOST
MSKQMAEMNKKSDRIENVIASMSDRLGQVEKKVGISLATLEQVKDTMVLTDETSKPEVLQTPSQKRKTPILLLSNEEELLAFDAKLGSDEEFYANVKRWLTRRIHANDPDNRMHIAMDLVFERTFLPLCSWTGNGRPTPNISLRTQTNITKLFAAIGSTKYFTAKGDTVRRFFLKKLHNAKYRVKLKNLRTSTCHKRKFTND